MNDAIIQTAWTPNAPRFLVLVGGAPGHEPQSHPWNYSGMTPLDDLCRMLDKWRDEDKKR